MNTSFTCNDDGMQRCGCPDCAILAATPYSMIVRTGGFDFA